MAHSHAVVWLDSREAKVFSFDSEDVEKKRVKADAPRKHVRHSGNVGDGKGRDNREYFEAILAEVEATLEDVEGWMIAGPDDARRDFEKYVRGHAEILAKKLEAGEAMDQLDDARLLAIARQRLN
jgi:stalled ribosome rescue protein Dom34